MSDHNTPESMRSRESFNGVADLYDRYRRGYPIEVLGRIEKMADIGLGSRILEIGPGTGQLTRPLLERGASVIAIELGQNLAARAQRNLEHFPRFEITVVSFEDWPLPTRPFDTVISATAFHWVDAKIRAAKSAQALRPEGTLVAIYPHQVLGGDAGFFLDSQRLYRQWGLSTDSKWRPPYEHDLSAAYQDIDQCPDLVSVTRRRIRKTQRFTTDEYVGLLRTDSLVLTLSEPHREGFLNDMRRLIDSHHAGMISRTFVYEIVAAKKP